MSTYSERSEAGADAFELIAGAPCLDFVNTLGGRRGGQTQEHLRTYADLVRWSEQTGIITAAEARSLLHETERRHDEAHRVLMRAVALREALYAVVMAVLHGRTAPAHDLTLLNAELAQAHAHLEVTQSPEGFAWRWSKGEHALERMLWDIARSAADLLVDASDLAIRQCASATCGWLFVDTTRNHSRRWCDMRGCGNRAKVRRHRARQHAAEAPA